MVYIKNVLILCLIKLAKWWGMTSFTRIDPRAPRILIISTTGLGDTLWGTPAIQAIKETYPQAFIGVLTSPVGYSVLSNNPYIDCLITMKHHCLLQLPSRLKRLRQLRFDTALVFHLSQRATLPLCYFSKPSQIIGTEGINKGLDALLTIKLPKKYQHEIQRRLDIAAQVGVTNRNPHLAIYPSQHDFSKAASILSSLSKNQPIIALHPGSKDRFKQWPPSLFIALGKQLQKEFNAHILVTGNQEEHGLTKDITEQIPGSHNLAGTLSIKQLAALLASLDIFVTNDTGPMHIAFAMRTKTVALFSATDPQLCGPFTTMPVEVLYKPKTCFPCLGKSCLDAFCMLQHSPKEVMHSISILLKKAACSYE
jgi:lipopolysaccharide heptosyltransferase II